MWTLQDAKNRFSTVVEAALAGRPQAVTRRGRAGRTVQARTRGFAAQADMLSMKPAAGTLRHGIASLTCLSSWR